MSDACSASWIAVSAAFGALGRAFLCLDGELRVLHASFVLDELLGPGAALGAEGRRAEDLLGSDLFGPAAPLRQALLAGERRESLRAILPGRGENPSRPVSVTAAPIRPPDGACDPRAAFVVVLRPEEEVPASAGAAGTGCEASSQTRRLQAALEEHHWRRSEAARALGISRTTLWRMMREAGIEA
jgi:hypothetical protein